MNAMYVDIAFSLNRTLHVPLLVVINSVLRNSVQGKELAPLRFNIVVPEGDRPFFEAQLRAAFQSAPHAAHAIFRVVEFTPPPFLKHYLDSKFREKNPQRRISRYMQYARLFLKSIFPDVSKVIYLDGDTLVVADIRALFAQSERLSADCYLGAVPQFFPALFYFTNPLKMLPDLRQFKSTFNSGVLLTDLTYWTDQTYRRLQHYLELDAQQDYRLYNLGDETVFNLMFKDCYLPLAPQWNRWGYGQLHIVAQVLKLSRRSATTSILHWSGGHHKPWQSDRVTYSALWRSYLPATCTTDASTPAVAMHGA